MAKEPVAKTWQRDRVDGRRYSRLTSDITPPSDPIIGEPQANSDTSITVSWTNGTDTQSGLGGSYLEYRTSTGPGAWQRMTVPVSAVPNNSAAITGLAANTFYDFRVANYDQARMPNVSAYSQIKSIATPPSATQLAPGSISIISPALSVVEGGLVSIAVERTGQGTLAPSVEADYLFETFASGTPSPATGTLRWTGAAGGIQSIVATTGTVSANQAGRVRITEVRVASGVTLPAIGTSAVAITVLNQGSSSGTTYTQNFVNSVGLEKPAGWSTATNGSAANRIRAVIADASAPGGACQRLVLTKATSSDYRVQVNSGDLAITQRETSCFGFSVLLELPYVYPLHTFVFQNHHGEPVRGTNDQLPQVPVRLEVEIVNGAPSWRMSTIYVQNRNLPHSGQPNTRTRTFSRLTGLGIENLGDAFHTLTPGAWTRWAFRIVWDERRGSDGTSVSTINATDYGAGHYPGNLEVWKNGVLVANFNYPIGFGPHVVDGFDEGDNPVHIGQLETYDHSFGIYNTRQPVPPVDQQTIGMRIADFRAIRGPDIHFVL